MRKTIRLIRDILLVISGILVAGMGIKGFLVSSGFIDGGVTGISMLLSEAFHVPLYWLLPIINLPFVVIGFYQVGWNFAIRSTLAILGFAVCVAVVPYPDVTHDKLLTALFGGFALGGGIGLAIRGGAVLDGTEIAALLISRNVTLLKVGDVILLFNILIFTAAALLLGIEVALYSVLTYLAASKTVNFLLHGLEEYTAIVIVSSRPQEVRDMIIHGLHRTVTIYKGEGGRTGEDKDILYCVVTRLEIGNIKAVIRSVDDGAFIVTYPLSDVDGGVIKKTAAHIA